MNISAELILEDRGKLTAEQIQYILDKAWMHPYSCNCEWCLRSWALVGPDGGEAGSYGLFTKEEVNRMQLELGIDLTD